MKPTVSPYEDRNRKAARRCFITYRTPEQVAERALLIRSLPTVNWKGKLLRTIRCHGTTGRGPHDLNVPESLLWALLDPTRYVCPFHAIR